MRANPANKKMRPPVAKSILDNHPVLIVSNVEHGKPFASAPIVVKNWTARFIYL
jgi:hypothetical protein